MAGCHVVINLGLPYSGIVVDQGEGFRPTKIRIPFDTIDAGWQAVRDLDIDVVPDIPLIQGTVLAGELEASHDHDQ